MSSIIFQPLLHDSLGWKQSNTTYADTYVWKTLRANKNAKLSKYGQHYQKELKKQQKLQEINEQETIQKILSSNPIPKTPPVVTVEYQQRETNSGSRTSQRSSTSVEELGRPATSADKEKEKETSLIIDANNDTTRHWLCYPNPKTPQYLIDIKQRLGQIKTSFVRPSSATSVSNEQLNVSKKIDADQRHFLDFNLPQTPDDLRAARHRIAKYRYNPALDNYPPRPQTCPMNNNETNQTPSNETNQTPSNETEPPPPPPPPPPKDDAWTNEEEENKTNDQEASTILIQLTDYDGMPSEYIQAVETANAAQEEYFKNLKLNNDKHSNSTIFRSSSASNEIKSESLNAYRNQQRPLSTTNLSSRSNDFNTWVRNATNKERESALKILQDVINQPIIGYDIPKKPKKIGPPSLRMNSSNRKLGRTRVPNRHTPCEICENQLIKRHIWSLNRFDSTVCPHQGQGIKPPIIQIRA